MDHFCYREGQLYAEGVALNDIATQVGTPVYCYSSAAIRQQFAKYAAAFSGHDYLIAYAMKANSNQAILQLLAKQGAGVDVVSQGELRRAVAAGIPANRIVFSGVGKTDQEMDYALGQEIHCFNVESEPELERLSARAQALGKTAAVALRVNPDIDAKTHNKIATGKSENKFGIPLATAREVYHRAARLPNLKIMGMDVHIGSQICELAPFEQAFGVAAQFIRALKSDEIHLQHIDVGGGLGIAYHSDDYDVIPSPADYAKLAIKHFSPLKLKIICEPGRSIVGNAGVLLLSVIYLKKGDAKNFVIVDGAMNDLIRPTLYDAWQNIVPVKIAQASQALIKTDIVGPVCETGDYLGLDRMLHEPQPGDYLAVLGAGAYGAVMAGTYNSRLLVPEVLVQNTRFAVIRPRKTYDDLIAEDKVPDWI